MSGSRSGTPTAMENKTPPASVNARSNSKSEPRDASIVHSLLRAMGVEACEPRVVQQLLEFQYRYTTQIVQDAEVYAHHANRSAVNLEDVRLAVKAKQSFSFSKPPGRQDMAELAQSRNTEPLPEVKNSFGLVLPPDEKTLTSATYQVEPSTGKGS